MRKIRLKGAFHDGVTGSNPFSKGAGQAMLNYLLPGTYIFGERMSSP